MNYKAVNKAVQLYEQEKKKDYLINPVSKSDAEIIKELREALKKHKINGLVAILDEYKFEKDDDLVSNLMEYNTNYTLDRQHEEEEGQEGGAENIGDVFNQIKLDYINILDCRLRLFDIHSYEKEDSYCHKHSRPKYLLILNKIDTNATSKIFHANKTFTFYSEEERDEIFDILEEHIGGHSLIRFIN